MAYQQTAYISDRHPQTQQPVQLASAIIDYAAAKRQLSNTAHPSRFSIHHLRESLPARGRSHTSRCVTSELINDLYNSDLNSTTSATSSSIDTSQPTTTAGDSAVRPVPIPSRGFNGSMNSLIAVPDSRTARVNMRNICRHAPFVVSDIHTECSNRYLALPDRCSSWTIANYNRGDYNVEPSTAASLFFHTQQQRTTPTRAAAAVA